MKVYIIVNGEEKEIEVKMLEDYLKLGDKLEILDDKLYIVRGSDK